MSRAKKRPKNGREFWLRENAKPKKRATEYECLKWAAINLRSPLGLQVRSSWRTGDYFALMWVDLRSSRCQVRKPDGEIVEADLGEMIALRRNKAKTWRKTHSPEVDVRKALALIDGKNTARRGRYVLSGAGPLSRMGAER